MMKFDPKTITAKFQPALQFAKRYIKFIFMIVLLIIFGFFVWRINQFSRIEPSEDAVNERLQTVQRPKIDKAALEKIQDLQSQNIQVQSLFDQARNNPFSE